MATKDEVQRCIELVSVAAQRNYSSSKVLPSIIVAQACLESGYLTSELATKANNCFGIKWAAYKTPRKHSYKGIDWSVFNSIEECVIQHGVYYNSKPHFYAELIGETDLNKALDALDKSPYCADVGYKEKLLKIINQYDLTRFDNTKGEHKSMKILIDPGHRNNLSDCGAVGNGLKESELALSISKLLKVELEACGQTCYLTRSTENEAISVSDRPKKAKELGADLLISVHINSAGPAAEGIEVLYKTQKALAEKVCNGMVAKTGARNRGAKQRTDLGVLNGFDKSILLECGFISNAKEAKLMNTKEYQKKLVKGIVKGVAEEFGFSNLVNHDPLVTQDYALITAVNEIIASGVNINAASWNDVNKINLKYVPGLLNKLGGLNKLVTDGVISSTEIWENGTYPVNHVRSLLIKYANRLG